MTRDAIRDKARVAAKIAWRNNAHLSARAIHEAIADAVVAAIEADVRAAATAAERDRCRRLARDMADHADENGKRLDQFGPDPSIEGRLRVLSAMHLRQFAQCLDFDDRAEVLDALKKRVDEMVALAREAKP